MRSLLWSFFLDVNLNSLCILVISLIKYVFQYNISLNKFVGGPAFRQNSTLFYQLLLKCFYVFQTQEGTSFLP